MDALRMGVAAANLGVEEQDLKEDLRRVIAVFPTIVAAYWRYRQGKEPVKPCDDLRHGANYLYMMTGEEPSEARAAGLETCLNTVADHGPNASTFTARVVVSTESDLVSAGTADVGTLKGPSTTEHPAPYWRCFRTCTKQVIRRATTRNVGRRRATEGVRSLRVPRP